MKTRLEEIDELIAENDRNKSEYRTLVWRYKSEECAVAFDKWLKNRINLEIEKHDILKNIR